MPSNKIAFIKRGSFSNINSSVHEALLREFPDYHIDVLDILDLIPGSDPSLKFRILSHLYAYKEFGFWLVTGREKMNGAGGCKIRTGYFFGTLNSAIQRYLAKDEYRFTFQTQSLFDASIRGTPHFVYTDQTERECLNYPNFEKSNLLPDSWLDREATIYHNADRVFTMSHNVSRCLVQNYGCTPEKVVCVGAGYNVPPQQDTTASGNGYANRNILFVGKQWQRKGGPQLVDAFRRVSPIQTEAQLTIVGCSPLLDVRNCNVAGQVPVSQIGHFYKRASVFCLPTTREAFGIAFIEAFAHKLPVVAPRFGPIPDFVRDGENGYLVEPGNTEQLADRLCDLLNDPRKCEQFGENGYRLVQEKYNWRKVGAMFRENIERVLRSH
jgi:glycosyltransferase involved in cell wall biosynthesis